LEPGAILPPHCHPNASVCTVGIAGEARIRNFEIVGQAPEFAARQAFRVRETHNGPNFSFSFLELENKPVDAEQRLFEAVWKQL
jgi:hypothetical protein